MLSAKTKIYALAASAFSAFLISATQVYAQAIIENPLGAGSQSFCGLFKNILNIVIAVMIPFLVLILIYAGFMFIFARGNAEKLKIARRNFLYVIIGAFVFLGCWVLVQIVANTINNVQTQSGVAGNNSLINCN